MPPSYTIKSQEEKNSIRIPGSYSHQNDICEWGEVKRIIFNICGKKWANNTWKAQQNILRICKSTTKVTGIAITTKIIIHETITIKFNFWKKQQPSFKISSAVKIIHVNYCVRSLSHWFSVYVRAFVIWRLFSYRIKSTNRTNWEIYILKRSQAHRMTDSDRLVWKRQWHDEFTCEMDQILSRKKVKCPQ